MEYDKEDILDWNVERQRRHDEEKEKAGCKGIFYRYRENSYYHNGKLEFKRTFTKLKRISCPGCDVCGFIEEDLSEDTSWNGGVRIVFQKELIPERIYEPKVVGMTTDFETGYADDWEIEFFLVEENESN